MRSDLCSLMNRKSLVLATGGLALLAACTTESPPLQLYFVGSSRFTSGNRTGLQPADTLAASLFAVADSAGGTGLQEIRVTTTYSPNREPFAYPFPLTAFMYASQPTGQQLTFYDTLFTAPFRRDFLFTSTFGIRTTTGSERWEFNAYDAGSRTATRAFTLVSRRGDSTTVYHDYTLRLKVPARGASQRRFIELKSGLALPGFTVLGRAATIDGTRNQQDQIDLIQSADGLSLYSPDSASRVAAFDATRWPIGRRRHTSLRLTTLTTNDFTGQTDTTAIRRLYSATTSPVRGSITSLVAGRIYAFRTHPLSTSNGEADTFGLLRILSVPGGSTSGLQLQIRTAKQPM